MLDYKFVETLELQIDMGEIFETGSWIWVSTLQGLATITIETEVKEPNGESKIATFAFTSSKGQIYPIHKNVRHSADAPPDRVANISHPKTWKPA